MSKKKKYLSYIEETRKHHSELEKVAKKATKTAINKSHQQSVSVTYLEDEKIIKVDSKGKKVTVGKLKNNRRKVKVGGKTTLSKK